jgi:hypothetical protein
MSAISTSSTAEESQPHPVASTVVSFAKEAKRDDPTGMHKTVSSDDRLGRMEVATDDEDLFVDAERTVHGPPSHEAVLSAAAAKNSNSSVTPIQAAAAATASMMEVKEDEAANQPISAEAVAAAAAAATAAAAAADYPSQLAPAPDGTRWWTSQPR